MEAAFCIDTLEDALARYGKPEIFNTDQGSQFTGQTFTGAMMGPVISKMRELGADERAIARALRVIVEELEALEPRRPA
jgi:transposase InsO family protein